MTTPTLEELPACPVETTLSLIGNKWQVLILRDLVLNGTMRFKELQRSIGKISQKVLTSNLRTMEDAGLVRSELRKCFDALAGDSAFIFWTGGQVGFTEDQAARFGWVTDEARSYGKQFYI